MTHPCRELQVLGNRRAPVVHRFLDTIQVRTNLREPGVHLRAEGGNLDLEFLVVLGGLSALSDEVFDSSSVLSCVLNEVLDRSSVLG